MLGGGRVSREGLLEGVERRLRGSEGKATGCQGRGSCRCQAGGEDVEGSKRAEEGLLFDVAQEQEGKGLTVNIKEGSPGEDFKDVYTIRVNDKASIL